MSDLENLKSENEHLKNQLQNNAQGIHGLIAQLEAHKGELADARTISLQLRTNLSMCQKSNNELAEKVKVLEEQLCRNQEMKLAEVPLKEIAKGK